jgi:hypothetical protein
VTHTGQLLVDLRKALLSEDWEAVKAVLMKAASIPYTSDEISHANEEVHNTHTTRHTQHTHTRARARHTYHTRTAETKRVCGLQVATKAASKEIIAKLVEATQTLDLEAMAYGIQQAIAMQLSDAPEVVEAEKLLKQATTAKLALQSALESVLCASTHARTHTRHTTNWRHRCVLQSVLDDLELAVSLARPFAFLAEDVARAEALGKAIYENDMVPACAVWSVPCVVCNMSCATRRVCVCVCVCVLIYACVGA